MYETYQLRIKLTDFFDVDHQRLWINFQDSGWIKKLQILRKANQASKIASS